MPRATFTLLARLPSGETSAHQAAPGAVLIAGRDAGCDIVLADPSVSARHVELTFGARHCDARDLGSRFGTLLDDRPVADAPWEDGATLWVGDVALSLNIALPAPLPDGQPAVTAQPTAPRERMTAERRFALVVAVVAAVALLSIAALFLVP